MTVGKSVTIVTVVFRVSGLRTAPINAARMRQSKQSTDSADVFHKAHSPHFTIVTTVTAFTTVTALMAPLHQRTTSTGMRERVRT